MNKQRLKVIAEWLEGGAKHADVKLDMSCGLAIPDHQDNDDNQCGAVCCVAGAAVLFFDPKFVRDIGTEYGEAPWAHIKDCAFKVLGLDFEAGQKLFEPNFHGSYDNLNDYNDPAWAARVVRKLIETGEVDWAGTEHVACTTP